MSEFEGNKSTPSSLRVFHKVMNLIDMEPYTGFVFFGTEDGYLDSTAQSLDKRFRFANDYKSMAKTVGKAVCIKKRVNYGFYCMIVSKTYVKDAVDFITLEQCIRDMYRLVKIDNTVYIAFEALKEWNSDPVFNEKVVTLMRLIVHWPVSQLWVCYPTAEDDPHKFTVDKTNRL